MYFKKKFIISNLYIIFFVLVLFLIQFSTNIVNAKTYKVENIEIEEPYDLNFNKNNIMEKAFKKAFIQFVSQVVPYEDVKYLKNTSIEEIKNLVDSFSIIDEKFVESKYFAKFNVDFEKKKFLNFFFDKQIISSIPLKRKVILLPILIDIENNQISLFSQNPFYKNWNLENQNYFLLKYVLPNEDLEDIKILQNKINYIEQYNFKEIVSKYDLDDNIITIIFKNENNIKVLSKVFLNNNQIIINKFYNNIDLNDLDNINYLIQNLKNEYENQWKKLNQINSSIKLSLKILLDSKNLDLINKFENNLSKLDLVSNYSVENFSSDYTVYKIMYNNTPDKFLSDLRSNGFEIDTSYKIWKLK